MFSYHVTFNNSKKVVSVGSLTEVLPKVKELFGLRNEADIQLQIYDPTWEDFVDVEVVDLPPKARLNAFLKLKNVMYLVPPDVRPDGFGSTVCYAERGIYVGGMADSVRNTRRDQANRCVISHCQSYSEAPYSSNSLLAESGSTVVPKQEIAEGRDEVVPVSPVVPKVEVSETRNSCPNAISITPVPPGMWTTNRKVCEEPKAAVVSSKASDTAAKPDGTLQRPWPIPFQLPLKNFSRSLRRALENGKELTKSLRHVLLEALYEEITKYTYYPTPSQYKDVARALLSSYNYLAEGLETDDAEMMWRRAMSNKMRNGRKNKDKVKENVRKKQGNGSFDALAGFDTCRQTADLATLRGLKDIALDVPVGEDYEETMRADIEWMIVEAQKDYWDTETVTKKMYATFEDRRKLIVHQAAPIHVVKELYPCLFSVDQLLLEFSRLSEINLEDSLSVGLRKYRSAVIDLAHSQPFMKEAEALVDSNPKEEEKSFLTNAAALVALPGIAGDKLNYILCDELQDFSFITTPIIVFRGSLFASLGSQFRVFVENKEVCCPRNVVQAFACLLASYYVYHVPYPAAVETTMYFVQRVFVNLPDRARKKSRFLNLLSKISARLKTLEKRMEGGSV